MGIPSYENKAEFATYFRKQTNSLVKYQPVSRQPDMVQLYTYPRCLSSPWMGGIEGWVHERSEMHANWNRYQG